VQDRWRSHDANCLSVQRLAQGPLAPESGHFSAPLAGLLSAKNGLMLCSKPNSDFSSFVVGRASALRCVTGKDKVASFGRLVAGEAGFVHRLVSRFAVRKVSEPPAARRGIFF
jgi:hypothetical protein